jgi:hypothetical protein
LFETRFRINRLIAGGVITNYYCTSRCRHCLYRSSPDRPKEYIRPETARNVFEKIRSMGCRSVHLGGGEPLLEPDSLAAVLSVASRTGIGIEYVETNSSWFRDAGSAKQMLSLLGKHGLKTLMVSISPFHNEFVPFYKIEGVMEAAREGGIRVLPWIDDFVPELSSFNPGTPHTMDEFESRFGPGYLSNVLGRYWVHPGGRALDTLRTVLPVKPLAHLFENNKESCAAELSNTTHFHIDLFGNYVPGLCSGLGIDFEDLGGPLDRESYPLLYTLFTRGIHAVFEIARERYGFKPTREGYLNKCDLCSEIRGHLVRKTGNKFKELKPLDFYR